MGFVSNRKNKGFGEVTVNEKKVESEMLTLMDESSLPLTDVLNAPDNYIFMPIISQKAQENFLKEDSSFYENIAALSKERDSWLSVKQKSMYYQAK